MTEELYNELKVWLAEAEKPRPNNQVREYGLCSWVGGGRLENELCDLWKAEGLDISFPFDIDNYFNDHVKHLNPRRLAWVRKQIALYEETHR